MKWLKIGTDDSPLENTKVMLVCTCTKMYTEDKRESEVLEGYFVSRNKTFYPLGGSAYEVLTPTHYLILPPMPTES